MRRSRATKPSAELGAGARENLVQPATADEARVYADHVEFWSEGQLLAEATLWDRASVTTFVAIRGEIPLKATLG